jgi:hypothetical protein
MSVPNQRPARKIHPIQIFKSNSDQNRPGVGKPKEFAYNYEISDKVGGTVEILRVKVKIGQTLRHGCIVHNVCAFSYRLQREQVIYCVGHECELKIDDGQFWIDGSSGGAERID